jgi:hypothetical protein
MRDDFLVVTRRENQCSQLREGRDTQAFRRHAERVGKAALAWNELHENLYMIFWFAIGLNGHPAEEQIAHSLWHTIQSDKTQRDMLADSARIKLSKNKSAIDRLSWILKQTNKLSTYRNMAIHTAVVFHKTTGNIPKANPWGNRSESKKRYSAINHERFWKLLIGDLMALSRYTGRLADDLWRPWHKKPSLRRPILQAVALINQIDNQLNPQNQQPKHPRLSSSRKAQEGKKSMK